MRSRLRAPASIHVNTGGAGNTAAIVQAPTYGAGTGLTLSGYTFSVTNPLDADWTFSSHALIGNLNSGSLSAGPTGTTLQVGQANATNNVWCIDSFGGSPNLVFRRANGTAASKTAIANGDVLGRNQAFGYANGAYLTNSRVRVSYVATEDWTSTNQGAKATIDATPAGSTTIQTVATFAAEGCQILGSQTGTAAASGYIGEVISSVTDTMSEVSLTTGTAADVTSIALGPGDYDVWGVVWTDNGAGTTISALHAWVSKTSATLPTAPALDSSRTTLRPNNATGNQITPVDECIIRVPSGMQTVYLGAQISFAVSTCAVYGKLLARRRA